MDEPKTPALATVKNVEIAHVGWWDISNADAWHPTAENMAQAVAAMSCPAVRRPVLKCGHTGVQGEGDPTLGSIDNLRLTDDGMGLIGDYVGIPGWLAEKDEGSGQSILSSAYPDRSGEFASNFVCQVGHVHPFVVRAVALLGVEAPGIGTLESLFDLYANAPKKEVVAMAKTANAGVTADKVRKIYYETEPAASDWNLWVQEMYVDPPELIVKDEATDELLRVPYTATGDSVEFGEAQSVKIEYVAARAKSTDARVYSCATKTEARPVVRKQSNAAETTEGTTVALTLLDSLRKKFELPDDATEADIMAKLAEDATVDDDNPAAVPAQTPDPSVTAPEVTTETEKVEPVGVAASASTRPDGTILMDASVLDQLQRDAADGRAARAKQVADEDEAILSAAIRAGRVTPASKETWRAQMAAGNGVQRDLIRKTVNELPVVVGLTELGHSDPGVNSASASDDTTDVRELPAYKKWGI